MARTIATSALRGFLFSLLMACASGSGSSAIVTSTSAPEPTLAQTATLTPTATATPAPTAIPRSTATPTPERNDPYAPARVPEHMASMWWHWPGLNVARQINLDVIIQNDPGDFSDHNGLYLMVCQTWISDQATYFGLQTNVDDPAVRGGRGKGLIFSRWGERDLAFARTAEGGWSQSSGHEGDFIGVRLAYEWGAGQYHFRLAPDGRDDDGEWYGVWVTDMAKGIETWAGSLKFPPRFTGPAEIRAPCYTTLEIYGSRAIRPIDIPQWHVSMRRPEANGVPARRGVPVYSPFYGEIPNSDVQYDAEEDVVHLRVGGATERIGKTDTIVFPQ